MKKLGYILGAGILGLSAITIGNIAATSSAPSTQTAQPAASAAAINDAPVSAPRDVPTSFFDEAKLPQSAPPPAPQPTPPPPPPTPPATYTPRPSPAPTPVAPTKYCCKHCSKGKACGNSCISRSCTCHQPPGCACDT